MNNAEKASQRGDWNAAYSSLQNADAKLSGAQDSWMNYTDATAGGAESIAGGLRMVRNGSFVVAGVGLLGCGASAAYAGGLALSGGGHAVMLSLLVEDDDQEVQQALGELAQKNNEASVLNAPKPEEKSKEQQAGLCQPTDSKNRTSGDYKGESCQPVVDPAIEQLEKRIGAAIREQWLDPRTVTKDTKALVAEAREALTQWKQDPTVVHKYGTFFLQTEAPNFMDQSQLFHLSELQKQWSKNASIYKAAVGAVPSDRGITAVMDKLFDHYLTLYIRDNANMSDMLDGRGGNCEAQTKLITAGITAGGVQLHPNDRLAVQLFKDHMQAVVYGKKNGVIHNLLTGEETTEIRAPLYDPHIFHHAYLENRSETSPVSIQDLLIVSGPVPYVGYVHSHSRNAAAETESPFYGQSLGWTDLSKKIQSFEELSEKEKKYFVWDDGGHPHPLDFLNDRFRMRLVFKTRDQKLYYDSLGSPDEKRNFLMTLTNQTIAERLSDPEVQRGLMALSDPSVLKKYKNSGVNKALAALYEVERVFWHVRYVIQDYCSVTAPIIDKRGQLYDNHDFVRNRIEEKNPMLRALDRRKDRLRERIKKHPVEFVMFMDKLPHKKRDEFINLVEYVDKYRGEDRGHARPMLQKVIANPQLIGVGEKPGYKPEIIEITFVDGKDLPQYDMAKPIPKEGDFGLKNEEGRKGKEKKKNEWVDESDAPYRVSAASMIDFAFVYAPERWTPELAKELRRLNRDGRYDGDFLKLYKHFNETYPKAQRIFDDPYAEIEMKNYGDKNEILMGEMSMMKRGDLKVSRDIYHILQEIIRRSGQPKK